jgi:hypothetical protein
MEPERGNFRVVTEGKDNGKLYLEGTFIQAEIRNQNQRVYPLGEITKAVKMIQEKIKSGYSVLGELDHPEELTINLDRVSHSITDMWMDGQNGCGKLKIIDSTPMGQIAKGLLEADVKLGVSSRGSGNVSHDGAVSDYEIVTVDIVAQPSAPEAYPKSIYESLYNMNGGSVIERVASDAAYGEELAQQHLPQMLQAFIRELKI